MRLQKLYLAIGLLTMVGCGDSQQTEEPQKSANIVAQGPINKGAIEIKFIGESSGEILHVSYLVYQLEDKDQKYERGISISPGSLDPLSIVAKAPFMVGVTVEQFIENRSEVFMTGISNSCPSFVIERNDFPKQISYSESDLCRVSETN